MAAPDTCVAFACATQCDILLGQRGEAVNGPFPKVTVELHHADVALTATPFAGCLPDAPGLGPATVTELVGALLHSASDMFACSDFAVRLKT
jgi:hypothetical protein